MWHPFIATANLKCQGWTWEENIAAYSYVTPFHHRPLLCSYCVCEHMCRQTGTDRQTDRQREREREREGERERERETHTHTHTHTRTHTRARACAHAKPANLLQCQISGCNAHWQYQASVNNNLHEGILKYLGLSKAHYSHKWWRNNPNLCQVPDSSEKTLLTPWSRVSQSIISPHFMTPKSSLLHSQVPTTCPYSEPDNLITNYKNVKE